jgi:hypothetical protein
MGCSGRDYDPDEAEFHRKRGGMKYSVVIEEVKSTPLVQTSAESVGLVRLGCHSSTAQPSKTCISRKETDTHLCCIPCL